MNAFLFVLGTIESFMDDGGWKMEAKEATLQNYAPGTLVFTRQTPQLGAWRSGIVIAEDQGENTFLFFFLHLTKQTLVPSDMWPLLLEIHSEVTNDAVLVKFFGKCAEPFGWLLFMFLLFFFFYFLSFAVVVIDSCRVSLDAECIQHFRANLSVAVNDNQSLQDKLLLEAVKLQTKRAILYESVYVPSESEGTRWSCEGCFCFVRVFFFCLMLRKGARF